MNGAEIIIKVLQENGVDAIFGYPGGTILNVYDELYKCGGKIKHYLTAHEQGAIHAADGYARSTGKVGVCFSTSGPGATNLVTGLAAAYMDSSPVVAITCNVNKTALGKDSFQEVDITGITMPITKHNFMVNKIEDLEKIVNQAFYIAASGRPGPVLIDIPKNITAEDCKYKGLKKIEYKNTIESLDADFDNVAQLINKASKIFIISGGGVVSSEASKEILELSKILHAPVSTTLMGMGSVAIDFENYTGMIGMHGTKASNIGITKSNLVIAIGTRFSDRVIPSSNQLGKGKTVIHIDIDPAEVNKNVVAKQELVGDAKLVLSKLLPLLKQKTNRDYLDAVLNLKDPLDTQVKTLNPQFIMREISKITDGENTIITTEVGQHQMWAARFFKYMHPKTLLTSGGLGAMGFGTGASIGAAVGNKNKRVFAIAGDGSFRMNSNELSTIKYYNLPIIIIIMNNGTLGMVRQWQKIFYGCRFSETTLDRGPDFVKLADAYDVKGFRVESQEEFTKVLKKAYSLNEPILIDCKINIDESIFPMVDPGGDLDQMRFDIK